MSRVDYACALQRPLPWHRRVLLAISNWRAFRIVWEWL